MLRWGFRKGVNLPSAPVGDLATMVFSVEACLQLGGIGTGENVPAMKPRCVGEEAKRCSKRRRGLIERSAAVGQPALRLLVHTIRYEILHYVVLKSYRMFDLAFF